MLYKFSLNLIVITKGVLAFSPKMHNKSCFLCWPLLFLMKNIIVSIGVIPHDDHTNRVDSVTKTIGCITCSWWGLLLFQLHDERLCWRLCWEPQRFLYWCDDYKRCCTLCFDLLATVQCNCTHIWKVHIGHSPLSIFQQLNGWLCLAVKKWAIFAGTSKLFNSPKSIFH